MKLLYKSIMLILINLLMLTGCNDGNNEFTDEEHSDAEHSELIKISQTSINEIGLKTEVIKVMSFTGTMNIPAKVLVNQDNEAQVGSLLQGRVYKVFVKAGDYVKAGQELMLVEGLEVGEIKAAYLTAKANLDFQKTNLERQKTLIEQNIGSQKSFQETKAEYEKALAVFNAEDKKIHSIGLNDDDIVNISTNNDEHTSGTLPVKSPISGIIVERNVVIGQLVDGTTNAFRIINTASVWIDGQINENEIKHIKEKTNVTFTAAAYPGEKFSGRTTYIAQTIDEKTRTIIVRAEFNNANGRLKPLMFGELHLPLSQNNNAILVPSEAVVKIDNADFVFVKRDDSTFEKRSVVTGITENEMTEIKSGLSVNEVVVTKGGFYLKSELKKGELEEHEH